MNKKYTFVFEGQEIGHCTTMTPNLALEPDVEAAIAKRDLTLGGCDAALLAWLKQHERPEEMRDYGDGIMGMVPTAPPTYLDFRVERGVNAWSLEGFQVRKVDGDRVVFWGTTTSRVSTLLARSINVST